RTVGGIAGQLQLRAQQGVHDTGVYASEHLASCESVNGRGQLKAARQLLHQGARQLELVGGGAVAGQGVVLVSIDQQQRVIVAPESGGPEVADDERHLLAQELGSGVFEQVLAFSRKTHAIRALGQRGNGRQDVRVLGQLESGGHFL